jgi:hypothetical protein
MIWMLKAHSSDSGKKFMKTSDWMGTLSIQNSGTSSFRLHSEILHATGSSKTLVSIYTVPHPKNPHLIRHELSLQLVKSKYPDARNVADTFS